MLRSDHHDARGEGYDGEGHQHRDDHDRRGDHEDGLSAKGGIQSSLKKILIMSATTCSRPKGPTRLGP